MWRDPFRVASNAGRKGPPHPAKRNMIGSYLKEPRMTFRATALFASIISVTTLAQAPFDASLILSQSKDEPAAQGRPAQPDWTKLQDETMQHYQALLRIDTRNPPGNETAVAEYLK